MHQPWDWRGDIQTHVGTLKNSQENMLGKGYGGGYPASASGESLQSADVADGANKKAALLDCQLPAGAGQTGQQQQNQQLFLSPASLQLAQLQAQLTLHRLKLAQSAVGCNTASAASAASAATVLNQVLSNVAMSQPLLNQLRTSAMVGNPQGAFPTGALGFSTPNPALGTLVGGGFNQHLGDVSLNSYSGGSAMGQQGGDYGKKVGFSADTDRRMQYGGFHCSAPGGSTPAGDGQYTPVNTQAKITNTAGFQRDFYGHNVQGQPTGYYVSDHKTNAYPASSHKEPWKGPANLCHTEKMDPVLNPAPEWKAAGQPVRPRIELYNPEEPTSEPKFNMGGRAPTQGFVAYQPLQGGEDSPGGGTMTLQPHQVSDYHGATPSHLPHQCMICDKKVYNLKDWDQHVKGKLHLQNRSLYATEGATGLSLAADHYAVSRASDGGLTTTGNSSMVYSAASQDVSSGTNSPAAGMKTYPISGVGFILQQPGSKPFPPRKSTPGRVVHICNLPEGSCTENDVINLGLPFGKVTNYILMRSTHQAFLEMAYVEAAQAMVQYYQLTPAMINDQKLLIRMSKRYKELQLKKPGKDVDLIIHDINSQRVRDEMQDLDHYVPERARSRSPISRSLSPRSHSPSFTSCSSAHSPPGGACRGPDRSNNNNGLGPCRGSWDWSSHQRRGEDERERDRERDEHLWRNGAGRDEDRVAERRKHFPKPTDRVSPRSADQWGGGGEGEGMRGGRDWCPRGSLQGMSFSSYRNAEEDFHSKDQMYKSEKPPRGPYQRHEAKMKRRDGAGDYHHSRPRHSEAEMPEERPSRTPEDRKQSSPARGRSQKTSRRHGTKEKHENHDATGNTDHQSKEKAASPQQSSNQSEEVTVCEKDRNCADDLGSGSDTDGECWYPGNMEELVTVDEVGGEDDSIIEPDLPELLVEAEHSSCTQEPTEADREVPPPPPFACSTATADEERTLESAELAEEAPPMEKAEGDLCEGHPQDQAVEPADVGGAASPPGTDLNDFPGEELKAALEEVSSDDRADDGGPSKEPPENPVSAPEDGDTQEVAPATETNNGEIQPKEEPHRLGVTNSTNSLHSTQMEIEAHSPSRDHDRAISEHSIPLGVEFIVPRTGFYCKLCGLFYASEETAKMAHCRSTVHYRNLQKYLSQLAEESLLGVLTEPPSLE